MTLITFENTKESGKQLPGDSSFYGNRCQEIVVSMVTLVNAWRDTLVLIMLLVCVELDNIIIAGAFNQYCIYCHWHTVHAVHQDGGSRLRSCDEKALLPLQLQIGFLVNSKPTSFHFYPASCIYCLHSILYYCSKLTVLFLLPAGLSEENEELITSVIRKEPICSGEPLWLCLPSQTNHLCMLLYQSYLYRHQYAEDHQEYATRECSLFRYKNDHCDFDGEDGVCEANKVFYGDPYISSCP